MDNFSFDAFLAVAVVALVGYLVYHFQTRHAGQASAGSQGGSGVLSEFCEDLNAKARQGKLGPVVGRDEEIERAIHIISRRTKNNPMLIGEPGVGKTAVVEGLAIRIVAGDVPESLKHRIVLELNLADILSGTKYRGEFEKRMRAMVDFLESRPNDYILFIDEIHVLEQSKGGEGSLNASDILKPVLARGNLAVIGATTWSEFEQYILPDAALERRFQPVLVDEPTQVETLKILRGIKAVYEDFHKVIIDDAALEAAVEASEKRIEDRFLPDKAIDVVDEAAAKVSIEASRARKIPLGIVHAAAKKAVEKSQEDERRPHVTEADVEEVVKDWEEHVESKKKRKT